MTASTKKEPTLSRGRASNSHRTDDGFGNPQKQDGSSGRNTGPKADYPGGENRQPDKGEHAGRGPSQATRLVKLAGDVELFHSGGKAYATVPVGEHRETWRVRTGGFRHWLAREYFSKCGGALSTQGLQDARAVLESKALFDGPERPVYTRLAEQDGHIYLDLANDRWQAVEITSRGWRVVANPPVKFRRAGGMAPLPHPVGGGSIEQLHSFLNVGTDPDWTLLVAWLIAALRPTGPFPVLCLHGEQGSAKSTAARVLRSLVDPNAAPLRSEPRGVRDLMIAATNGWVVALENLSHLPVWLSDCLCRLATGGGFATRELYTDSEEVLFDAQRPVILNGIEELAVRGDLVDRAIIVNLPSISDDRRRDEKDFWRDFHAARPKILGALLSAVSEALRRLPSVKLDRLPRMADFALWATAAEPALGLADGAFLDAYFGNRESANELALESSPVAQAVRELVAEPGKWMGCATELWGVLCDRVSETTQRQKSWPKSPVALSGALRRLAPNLRQVGVEVDFGHRGRGKAKRRDIAIRMGTHSSVPIVPVVPTPEKTVFQWDDGDADGAGGDAAGTHGAHSPRPGKQAGGDDGDDGDAKKRTHSEHPQREVFEI